MLPARQAPNAAKGPKQGRTPGGNGQPITTFESSNSVLRSAWDQLDAAARMGSTQTDVAAACDVTIATAVLMGTSLAPVADQFVMRLSALCTARHTALWPEPWEAAVRVAASVGGGLVAADLISAIVSMDAPIVSFRGDGASAVEARVAPPYHTAASLTQWHRLLLCGLQWCPASVVQRVATELAAASAWSGWIATAAASSGAAGADEAADLASERLGVVGSVLLHGTIVNATLLAAASELVRRTEVDERISVHCSGQLLRLLCSNVTFPRAVPLYVPLAAVCAPSSTIFHAHVPPVSAPSLGAAATPPISMDTARLPPGDGNVRAAPGEAIPASVTGHQTQPLTTAPSSLRHESVAASVPPHPLVVENAKRPRTPPGEERPPAASSSTLSHANVSRLPTLHGVTSADSLSPPAVDDDDLPSIDSAEP